MVPKNPAYDHNWAKIRLQVLERDRHVCQIALTGCTVQADSVDHIVPLSEGGARLDPRNLRASCRFCNLSRNGSRASQLAAALVADTECAPSRKW